MPGRSPGVPAWDDVAAERRTLYARYMELYAAIVDNIDQNIGRLKDHLTRLGRLDNTLFIVTSDNGANGIGGVDGAVNNLVKRLMRTEDPDVVRRALDDGRLGAADTWPAYPLGWTDVSSAPFRLYKTTTMNGGIRVPFVAHWPAGIRDEGAVRHQWMHVTDVLPTLLDVLDVRYPERFSEHPHAIDGRRQLRAPLFASGDARPARTQQHYELAGNRGYIRDGWKIVSLQPPGTADGSRQLDAVRPRQRCDRDAGSRRGESGSSSRAGRGVRRRCRMRTTSIRSTIATCADR